MKKHINRILTLALTFVMVSSVLAGCGLGSKSEQSKTLLFSYDGSDVYLDEAWVYAKIAQTGFESQYASTFGDSMWSMQISQDSEGNPVTMENMVKQNVIVQIKQVKVLNKKAKELKISLTDEEKKLAAKNAKAFAGEPEGQAIFKETGADQDLMQKIYEENALASKVQQHVVKDVSTEVKDDEARKTTVYKLVFPTTKTNDETGEKEQLSETKQAEQRKLAEEAYKKLKSGKSIEDLAKEYKVEDTAKETYGKGQSLGGKEFEKAIAGMKDGQTSKVMKTDEGYVIAKLVAFTDEEATMAEKENIVAGRQSEAYQKQYDEWTKDLEKDWDYEKNVDQKVWAQVSFGKQQAEAEAEAVSNAVKEAGKKEAEQPEAATEEK